MKLIKGFPHVVQQTEWTCGPSSLQAVLAFYGVHKSEANLARRAKTSKQDGTTPTNLVKVARSLGFKVVAKSSNLSTLKEFLDKGIPCIVSIQEWSDDPNVNYANEWESGHYVVAIGYDRRGIIVEDPSIYTRRSRGRYTFADFKRRWHDYEANNKVYLNYLMAIRPGNTVETNKTTSSHITSCCNGKRKTAGGFKWKRKR